MVQDPKNGRPVTACAANSSHRCQLFLGLYAARLRVPDVLVELRLHASRDVVFKHPLGQCTRRQAGTAEDFEPLWLLVHRRQQDRTAALIERVFRDHAAGPFVVGSIHEDELDLIPVGQVFEVFEQIAFALPAAGRLGSHGLMSQAPEVSISTVRPALQRAVMSRWTRF